jgi:pyrroloquinoline-quinone synthase
MKDHMQELIDQILAECGFRNGRYFESLRNGSFDREDFIETQIQFYFAVIFFSRPMAALAAKIPSHDLRIELVRNVWEEHGEGDPARVHGTTFIEFLRRLSPGLTEADIESRSLWPEVRIFNTCLVGACVLDEYLVGTGIMGMIERMFSEISTWIGQGVVKRGFIEEGQMIHYSLHEKLDIKHSKDFFDVLQASWDRSSDNRYYIEQGLRTGATLFAQLYESLYEKRKRRLMRTSDGPHSRAASAIV